MSFPIQFPISFGYQDAGKLVWVTPSVVVSIVFRFKTELKVKTPAITVKVAIKRRLRFPLLKAPLLGLGLIKIMPRRSEKSMANIAIGDIDFSPKQPQLSKLP